MELTNEEQVVGGIPGSPLSISEMIKQTRLATLEEVEREIQNIRLNSPLPEHGSLIEQAVAKLKNQ